MPKKKKPEDYTKAEKLAAIRAFYEWLMRVEEEARRRSPGVVFKGLTPPAEKGGPELSAEVLLENNIEELKALDEVVPLAYIHQWFLELVIAGSLNRAGWERFRLVVLITGTGLGGLGAAKTFAEGFFVMFMALGLTTPANTIPTAFIYAGYIVSFVLGILVGIATYLAVEVANDWLEKRKKTKNYKAVVQGQQDAAKKKNFPEDTPHLPAPSESLPQQVSTSLKAMAQLTERVGHLVQVTSFLTGMDYDKAILKEHAVCPFTVFFQSEDNTPVFSAKLAFADQLFESIFQKKPSQKELPSAKTKDKDASSKIASASVASQGMFALTPKDFAQDQFSLKKELQSALDAVSPFKKPALPDIKSKIEPLMKKMTAYQQQKVKENPNAEILDLSKIIYSALQEILLADLTTTKTATMN